jgi:GNAT superfamily N-acetyltransferase
VLLKPITHDLRKITSPKKLSEIVSIENQVWGEDIRLGESLAKELKSQPDHLSVYVAYADRIPISCAWLRLPMKGQFASLWGGATLPAYRQHGFYTALLAVRVQQEARQHGVRFLTIDAMPMSRPIVAKFGFQLLTYTYPCQWKVKK